MRITAYASEKEFQRDVIEFAELYGWNTWHQLDSRNHTAGVSDTLFWRDPNQFSVCAAIAELKIGKNTTTKAQDLFLAAFGAMGVPCYLWYPEHWPAIETLLTSEGAKPCPKQSRGKPGKITMTTEEVVKLFRLNKTRKIPPSNPSRGT